MTSFDSAVGLNKSSVRTEIGFPIYRENLISEDHEIGAGKDSVIRIHEDGDMETLGIISKRRGDMSYPEMMDWMTSEFDGSGFDYKLIESVVDKKGNLFQQYLFNIDMDTPDGQYISPMVIAKASYVQKPLEILFGTYRFVCSNGAIVGNTVESINIKSRELNDLSRLGLRSDMQRSMDGMVRVSEKYKELSQTPFTEYLDDFIVSDEIPTGLKKDVLYGMEDSRVIQLNLEDNHRLKSEDFKTRHPNALYTVTDPISGWDLYNRLTEVSTHNSRGVGSQTKNHKAVSQLLGV